MLKVHSRLFEQFTLAADLVLIGACWLAAYALRFYVVGPSLVAPEVAPLRDYLLQLLPILVVWGLAFRWFGLYRPRRLGSRLSEWMDVAKASTLGVLVLIAVMTFAFPRTGVLARGDRVLLGPVHRGGQPVARGLPREPPGGAAARAEPAAGRPRGRGRAGAGDSRGSPAASRRGRAGARRGGRQGRATARPPSPSSGASRTCEPSSTGRTSTSSSWPCPTPTTLGWATFCATSAMTRWPSISCRTCSAWSPCARASRSSRACPSSISASRPCTDGIACSSAPSTSWSGVPPSSSSCPSWAPSPWPSGSPRRGRCFCARCGWASTVASSRCSSSAPCARTRRPRRGRCGRAWTIRGGRGWAASCAASAWTSSPSSSTFCAAR